VATTEYDPPDAGHVPAAGAQLALPDADSRTPLQRMTVLFDGPVAWNETLPPVTGPEPSVTVAEKLPWSGRVMLEGPEIAVVVPTKVTPPVPPPVVVDAASTSRKDGGALEVP
jgi:hypothetical protein